MKTIDQAKIIKQGRTCRFTDDTGDSAFVLISDDLHYPSNRLFDGEYIISISKHSPKRTLPQLKYLFGVIYKTIADHTGHTLDEVHQYFKQLYLTKTIEIGDNYMRVPRSLSDGGDVSVEEVIEYIESVKFFGYSHLGLRFPDDIGDID